MSQEVQSDSPAYIRFGKGGEEIVSDKLARSKDSTFSFVGNFKAKRVVITTGVSVQPALSAIRNLFDESSSLLVHASKLNSFSAEFVEKVFSDIKQKKDLVTIRKNIIEDEKQFSNDYHQFQKTLFECIFHSDLESTKKTNCLLIVSESMYADAIVVDKEINTFAMLLKLSEII